MENYSTAVYRLSPQQRAVWLGQAEDFPWNLVCLLHLDGPIDESKLRQSLTALAARHEVLRTVYRLQPGMKVPFQMVLDAAEPAWNRHDFTSLEPAAQQTRIEDLFDRETRLRFDYERGPSLRCVFVALGRDRAAMLLSVSALSGDSRSWKTLVRDFGSIYNEHTDDLAENPLRYAQFAQWQIDLLESTEESASEGNEYWSERKSGAGAPLVLPESFTSARAFQPAVVADRLPLGVSASIDAVARNHGASTQEVLLAAFQSLLWRLTGQTHFETRVFSDGREYEELEFAVGAIGKFLPIPARFDGDFSFKDILDHVRTELAGATHWQEYFPCGDDAEKAGAIAFEYAPLTAGPVQGEMACTIVTLGGCSERFALKLSAWRSAEGLSLEFHFDPACLNRDAVTRWLGHFKTLLLAMLDNPAARVDELPLLGASERRVLLEDWNRTEAEYSRTSLLHQLFERQALRTPAQMAVRAGGHAITYAELNERANQLARYINRTGVKAGSLVGLALDRSVDMMIGLLAILKAGAAYVPLNADNPKPRLKQQLAGASALITETKFAAQLPELDRPRICLDTDGGNWQDESRTDLGISVAHDSLVYVIFTSGSTGIPKGVGVTHRNLVNYAEFIQRILGADGSSNALHFATVSTLSADLGNTCIFPSLISGGCLHIIGQDVASDSAQLSAYCRQHPIDVLKIVPSHLEALLETAEGAGVLPRKHLITGGEALTWRLVRRIRQYDSGCRILNHYGPTETTVGSLTFPVGATPTEGGIAGPIPIGRPIANTRVYILDSLRQPAPVGVAGELYIAGDGVTAGYLGQEELTRERFPDDLFCTGKMYRTGDMARYQADGNVVFLGRADDQVKIRGFRIEPGEIEAALKRFRGVRQAAVIARRDARGDMRLIGYVVADPGQPVGPAALREYLKEQLPDYMVPAALVTIPKLPLTPNGKIDRQNLPEPEQVQVKVFVAPRTETEAAVAGIWSEVFRRGQIGVDDHFFEIGGHSLTATQVISRVREQFRITLDMRVVFEHPTIEGMAAAIEAARTEPEKTEPAIMAVSRERYRRK